MSNEASADVLTQNRWYCDSCGEVINRSEEGWLAWVRGGNRVAYQLRIVHIDDACPEGQVKCRNAEMAFEELSRFVGTEGLLSLLYFVDPGSTS